MTDATVKSLREGVGILHSALKCICHTLLILLPQKVIFHFLVEKLNYNRISFFSPSTNTLYSSVEYLKKQSFETKMATWCGNQSFCQVLLRKKMALNLRTFLSFV